MRPHNKPIKNQLIQIQTFQFVWFKFHSKNQYLSSRLIKEVKKKNHDDKLRHKFVSMDYYCRDMPS